MNFDGLLSLSKKAQNDVTSLNEIERDANLLLRYLEKNSGGEEEESSNQPNSPSPSNNKKTNKSQSSSNMSDIMLMKKKARRKASRKLRKKQFEEEEELLVPSPAQLLKTRMVIITVYKCEYTVSFYLNLPLISLNI